MDASIASTELLKKTIADLNAIWVHTHAQWHDKQKLYFERTYIKPINESCRSSLRAWEELVEIIKQAEEQILNQE